MKKSLSIFLVLLMSVSSLANEFYAYYATSLFGFGYTYFFTPSWGFGGGLEKAFYNTERKWKEYTKQPYVVDDIEYRSTAFGYKEEKIFRFLQIPLMLQYQSENKFYAKAGTKIGIPLSGKNKMFADSVKNSGYREFEDFEYTTQEFMGFGTFKNQKSEEKLSLQTAILLSAEAGMKWRIKKSLRLYTGLYFDYGLDPSPIPLTAGLKLNLAYPFSESKILK